MKIYAPDDQSWVPLLERGVEYGEEVDLDDDLAAGFVEQGWLTKKPKPRPAAEVTTGGTTTDAPETAPTEEN